MYCPFEILYKTIETKIILIKENAEACVPGEKTTKIIKKVEAAESIFMQSAILLLAEFCQAKLDQDEEKMRQCTVKLNETVVRYDYLTTLDGLCKRVFTQLSTSGMEKKAQTLRDSYSRNIIKPITIASSNYKICTICRGRMEIKNSLGYKSCISCGNSEKIYGTAVAEEDSDLKCKNTYVPAKHARLWIDRIQAREIKEFPDADIERIKRKVNSSLLKNVIVDSNKMYKYLKELNLTKYNEHVPLLIKEITKREPPQLTHDEYTLACRYLSIIIENYEMVKPRTKTNCPYHPFFAAIVLQHILPAHEKRTREILSYIHFQSDETLAEDEKIWKQVCPHVAHLGFKYKPINKFAFSI